MHQPGRIKKYIFLRVDTLTLTWEIKLWILFDFSGPTIQIWSLNTSVSSGALFSRWTNFPNGLPRTFWGESASVKWKKNFVYILFDCSSQLRFRVYILSVYPTYISILSDGIRSLYMKVFLWYSLPLSHEQS